MANQDPQIGDIVLVNQPDGTQLPAIVTRVVSPIAVTLFTFGLEGGSGSSNPAYRGNEAGQWQPRTGRP